MPPGRAGRPAVAGLPGVLLLPQPAAHCSSRACAAPTSAALSCGWTARPGACTVQVGNQPAQRVPSLIAAETPVLLMRCPGGWVRPRVRLRTGARSTAVTASATSSPMHVSGITSVARPPMQVSRTTSIMSWKSAQSHWSDDDSRSDRSGDGGADRSAPPPPCHSPGGLSLRDRRQPQNLNPPPRPLSGPPPSPVIHRGFHCETEGKPKPGPPPLSFTGPFTTRQTAMAQSQAHRRLRRACGPVRVLRPLRGRAAVPSGSPC